MENTFERNGKTYKVIVPEVMFPFKGQNKILTAGEITIHEEAQEWLIDKEKGEGIVVEVFEEEAAKPVKPVKPVKPAKPAKTEEKSEPVKPAKPQEPTELIDPSNH